MTGYRIQIPPTTALHRREIELRVRQLRDLHRALGVTEVWFETRDDVLTYLNETVGVRTQHGGRISAPTLRTWVKHKGFPLYRSGRTARIASSNILIMAWLWSYRTYQVSHRTSAPVAPNANASTL